MKRVLSALLCVAFLLVFTSCNKTAEEETALFEADSGKISIVSVQSFDGEFVENGKSAEVTSVVSVIVENKSDKMLEYGKITLIVNDYERAVFEISALPAGEKLLAMEKTARPYNKDDKFQYKPESSVFSYCDASLKEDKVTIAGSGSDLSVKNVSNQVFTARLTYKYYRDGMYYGGIAFRGNFKNVPPGETVTQKSDIYDAEKCKIVNVEIR